MADAHDPFSTSTRTYKRNLLALSVVTIAIAAFGVSVDSIPVAGLSFKFDPRLLSFLLLAALIYFFISFCIYYFVDIKNMEQTPHEQKSEKAFQSRLGGFSNSYGNRISADLRSLAPKGILVATVNSMHFPQPSLTYALRTRNQTRPNETVELPADQLPELRELLDRRLREWLDRYPAAVLKNRRRAGATIALVRLLYKFRIYGLDGALPIALALVALLALLGVLPLTWLHYLVPTLPGQITPSPK